MDTARIGKNGNLPWLGLHLTIAIAMLIMGLFILGAGIRYEWEFLAALGFIPLGVAVIYLFSLLQEVWARAKKRRAWRAIPPMKGRLPGSGGRTTAGCLDKSASCQTVQP